MVDESGNHHEMVQVHELGFVKLLDVMGDDQEVINLSVTELLAANDKLGVIFSAYGATWRIYGGHSTFSGFLVG